MSLRIVGVLCVSCLLLCTWACTATETGPASSQVSLKGAWEFRLDGEDVGIEQQWFLSPWGETIHLPGVLQAQGFGEDVGVETSWTGAIIDKSWFTAPEYEPYRQPDNIKVPFWLQPDKVYVGAAWYRRGFEIPRSWVGKRVVLILERPHWETRVWLDGDLVGNNDSLSTPHEYDLGVSLEPGSHQLTVRVDNRLVIELGSNSHSVTDHTQGNWNGIVGEILLEATPSVWIEDLQVYPDLANRELTVRGSVKTAASEEGQGVIRFSAAASSDGTEVAQGEIPVTWGMSGESFETRLALDQEVRLWDEFTPFLYELTATLNQPRHIRQVQFGLRELKAEGSRFILNGHPLFLRGTLECAIFPRTGHPPSDVESWRKVIRAAKAHGLNHIRFHSWCPPEAAFDAADELGFYFHVECGSWANFDSSLGDGNPVDAWLYEEADRILRAYGNHPSFLLLLYGNEPGGDRQEEYLAEWIKHFRMQDSRRLYSSGAGWPQIPENDFHVTPDPRIQGWGQGLNSRINALPPETVTDYREYVQQRKVPVISHEIGQWCVYPNFDEMPKYTGYLKPRNFEIFRETLTANHMVDQARDFLQASGKLQALCYKEDIESALRTPGMGGFQLLDLHDFPGQGTALVGVLDPFWEEKGYIRPEAFKRFSGSTVPLARMKKRVFTTAETLVADIEISHFGAAPLQNVGPYWKILSEDEQEVASGSWSPRDLELGSGIEIGRVSQTLERFRVPARYRLVVGLQDTDFENDWDFWVYPTNVDLTTPDKIQVTRELDSRAIAALDRGEKVFWLIPPSNVAGDEKGPVATGFSSIFWNTAWTNRQAPHTLGILCDPEHPALAQFPTEFHSNWQWWYPIHHAQSMILDGLPPGIRPVVQMIDDWFTNRRLGLVFEARVGAGKLLVTSIDLTEGAKSDPVSRQLLASLYAYLGSSSFAPRDTVTLSALKGLVQQSQ